MRTEERKDELGEVFTPSKLVEEILDKLSQECWDDHSKTWLDPTCGNGNFLVAVKERLLKNNSLEQVLSRIYGVDIMQDNIDECRARLDPDNLHPCIVNKNIVCADGLRHHYRFDGSPPYDKTQKEKQEDLNNSIFF